MLAVSGTLVNASVNLTRHVAATRESESDRAHVRFSDLLMCVDLTDLRIGLTLDLMLMVQGLKVIRFFGFAETTAMF